MIEITATNDYISAHELYEQLMKYKNYSFDRRYMVKMEGKIRAVDNGRNTFMGFHKLRDKEYPLYINDIMLTKILIDEDNKTIQLI